KAANKKHHNHTSSKNMDKVKIKRAKRIKKPISTKEKILAGLGVGGTLMGGIAAGQAKPSQDATRFVRTQTKDSSSASGKIKQELKNIFSIPKASADSASGVGDIE